MSTDPDRELRHLARAMVADDDPPTIPPWPLDADVEPRGSGPLAGRRLLAVAATVILVVAAVGGLVALGMGDDAAPDDDPATSAPPATVTTTPTVTAAPTTVTSAIGTVTTVAAPPSSASAPSTAAATTSPSTPSVGSGPPPSTSALAPCQEPPGQDHDYPLQRCDVGLAVGVLIQELAAKGYLPPSTFHALFDDQVDAAVRAFQADHGLVVDGLVGPITWAAITADYQRRVGDPNGDGHLDPAEVQIIGDANEQ